MASPAHDAIRLAWTADPAMRVTISSIRRVREPKQRAVLSSQLFVAVWWLMLLFELINASVLVSSAYIYLTAESRDSLLWFLKSTFLYSEAQHFL